MNKGIKTEKKIIFLQNIIENTNCDIFEELEKLEKNKEEWQPRWEEKWMNRLRERNKRRIRTTE